MTIREGWVDGIRVIGAFLVVLAHIGKWGEGPEWVHPLAYTFSRIGVPLFFMLSGFLLLPKEENLVIFLRKRAWKVFLPLVAWSLIYDVYVNQALSKSGVTLEAVVRLLIRLLRGPRAEHLWFFYTLIGLYLFTPILRLFVARARQSDLLYYIGLWFFTVPLLSILTAFTPLRFGFEIPMATGYIGYYLLGFYLGNLAPSRQSMRIFATLFIFGLLFTFFVFLLDLPPQKDETVFRSYLSLNIILMGLAAFFLLKNAFQHLPLTVWHGLLPLSQASLGIYLIHPLVLQWYDAWLPRLGLTRGTGSSFVMIPLITICTFVISFLLTRLLQKIPLLRAIVP